MSETRYPNPDAMQASPEAAFAPMPLRVRGVLENLDVAIKAFKQYFWVLVGWAAIVNGINSIPGVSYFSYFFTPPLMVGAAACCVAAAVRGQRVSFAQCWKFTQPRYWSIVGMHVCALLIAGLLIGILVGTGVVLAIGGAYVFGNAPGNLATIGIAIASFIVLILFGVAVTAIGAWNTLVGIVACMEDDKRNSRALARAYELLRGQWRPVIGLMMLLGMGMLVLWMIVGVGGMLMGGLTAMKDLFNGTPSDATALLALAGFFFSSWLVLTFYMPIHYLAMTLVYLDLRVRKEALDIEWTAHQTAPEPLAAWDSTPAQSASFGAMPAQWDNDSVATSAMLPDSARSPDSAATVASVGVQSTSTAPDTFAAQPNTPNPQHTTDQSTFIASAPALESTVLDAATVAPVFDNTPDNRDSNAALPTPEQHGARTSATETAAPGTSDEPPAPQPATVNAPRW